jgi:hypothetical protein
MSEGQKHLVPIEIIHEADAFAAEPAQDLGDLVARGTAALGTGIIDRTFAARPRLKLSDTARSHRLPSNLWQEDGILISAEGHPTRESPVIISAVVQETGATKDLENHSVESDRSDSRRDP